MVLLLNSERLTKDFKVVDALLKLPHIIETANAFANSPVKTIPGDSAFVYVYQREFATVDPRKTAFVKYCGSEEATTCYIVIFRAKSGKVSVAHYDGSAGQIGGRDCSVQAQIDTFSNEEKSGGLDIYIAGGFNEQSYSYQLGTSLLNQLIEIPVTVNLKLACIFTLNNYKLGNGYDGPRVRGMAVELQTGEVFPCHFEKRGPDDEVRGNRWMSHSAKLSPAFDSEQGYIQVLPFQYYSRSKYEIERILNLPDDVFLSQFSTSPFAEAPEFVQDSKRRMKFIGENPSHQQVFNNKSRLHQYKSGSWVQLN